MHSARLNRTRTHMHVFRYVRVCVQTEEAVIMKHLYAAEQRESRASTTMTPPPTKVTATSPTEKTKKKEAVALRNHRNGIVKKKKAETTAKANTDQSSYMTRSKLRSQNNDRDVS